MPVIGLASVSTHRVCALTCHRMIGEPPVLRVGRVVVRLPTVKCFAPLLALLLTALRVAGADDWPMFHREPALCGVAATALPDKLAPRWTFKTGAAVKSSAAIVGGTVFVGSTDSNVYALAADTGKVRWKFATCDIIEAAPLVFEGAVFIGSSDGTFYALDAVTGALKWKFKSED